MHADEALTDLLEEAIRQVCSKDELVVVLGGRAAEEIIFSNISTGAADDIRHATRLAQKMVCTWGMSKTLGPLSFSKEHEQIFMGREIGRHRDYSEETAQKIDTAIVKLIDRSYNRARKVLNENRDMLHQLAALLLEKETVTGPELDDLIRSLKN